MTEARHSNPVWRDRADFIIGARIDPGDTNVDVEQLWARRLRPPRFEICCVPFFVYDLALGDIVDTTDNFDVTRVVEPSGRFVFRVYFGATPWPREELARELIDRGALIEWSSLNLLAVDARDSAHASQIADLLQAQEGEGRLQYETGRTE